MAGRYREIYFTPEVLAAQAHYNGKPQVLPPAAGLDPLTDEELEFIARRDSFYMATVTSDGWPYVQHRGGRPGFLKSIGPHSLAFADFKGNRQLLSTGNLAADRRVALILMDYPRQERLKIIGHARVEEAHRHPEVMRHLADPADQKIVERIFFIDVISFDWNCPQFITPRYTEEEMAQVIEPLKKRVAELERALESATADRIEKAATQR